MSKRRYSFFITEDLDAGLKSLKERDGVPEAESIRRALKEYLRERGIAPLEKAERKRAATRRRS